MLHDMIHDGPRIRKPHVAAEQPSVERYERHEYWLHRSLTPAQLLVTYIQRQEELSHEIKENSLASVYLYMGQESVVHSHVSNLIQMLRDESLPLSEQDRTRILHKFDQYGWINTLRLMRPETTRMECRWIHISSLNTTHLRGFLSGLSLWHVDPVSKARSLKILDQTIESNERFSIHGSHFQPFCQMLSTGSPHFEAPVLLSVPFLDWSTDPGQIPPLRFQVDKTEKFAFSPRFSVIHPVRTILQYYYRLEDTTDRERLQVFAKHKPWTKSRDVDLNVRRWYGQYPSRLIVDELWLLIVDSKHIVSFSSNQTWKARWPPLQLYSRIYEVAFRGISNLLERLENDTKWDAFVQAAACLSGAIGLVHRGFGSDVVLPLSDRYAGYISHLQYRLYRAPSTKLVMELLQVQDELNIINNIAQEQEEVLQSLSNLVSKCNMNASKSNEQHDEKHDLPRQDSGLPLYAAQALVGPDFVPWQQSSEPADHDHSHNLNIEPIDYVLQQLRREKRALEELLKHAGDLANRTVQLVNIRQEDHGQAILVFTVVTIVFLPLSFLASFFGMNVVDIREMTGTQTVFWIPAAVLTFIVVCLSSVIAFYGTRFTEMFVVWRDTKLQNLRARRQAETSRETGFAPSKT